MDKIETHIIINKNPLYPVIIIFRGWGIHYILFFNVLLKKFFFLKQTTQNNLVH